MTAEVKVVLFYDAESPKFVCGQTIGADGCGPRVLLLCGDSVEACLAKAEEIIALLKSRYAKLETKVVINEEGFSGYSVAKLVVR
jgi:hypothetical protein